MKKQVRVINKTGMPQDTQVVIDGKKLPLSHLLKVDINITPDHYNTVDVRLIVDDIDVVADIKEVSDEK